MFLPLGDLELKLCKLCPTVYSPEWARNKRTVGTKSSSLGIWDSLPVLSLSHPPCLDADGPWPAFHTIFPPTLPLRDKALTEISNASRACVTPRRSVFLRQNDCLTSWLFAINSEPESSPWVKPQLRHGWTLMQLLAPTQNTPQRAHFEHSKHLTSIRRQRFLSTTEEGRRRPACLQQPRCSRCLASSFPSELPAHKNTGGIWAFGAIYLSHKAYTSLSPWEHLGVRWMGGMLKQRTSVVSCKSHPLVLAFHPPAAAQRCLLHIFAEVF